MSFVYTGSGQMFITGVALTPCFGYTGSGGLNITGSTGLISNVWSYEGTGSIFLPSNIPDDDTFDLGLEDILSSNGDILIFDDNDGNSGIYITETHLVSGLLKIKGYADFIFKANIVPIPITPLVIAGLQQSRIKRPLRRIYNHDAAINGFWTDANSAFLPVGTAVNYKVLRKTSAEPNSGLIISEN